MTIKASVLLEEFKKKILLKKRDKFHFLLVGRTGVGKSSTVNSLLGMEVAPIGHYEATTMDVETYDSEIDGVQFTVFDTPGLCDDLEEEGNDELYLSKVRNAVTEVDCLWFVTRLDETRVTSDERRGIKLLTKALGRDVWEHAVIVFTFANQIPIERFDEALQIRTELIKKAVIKYCPEAESYNIPSVAVDNKSERLLNGTEWLAELYTKVFTSISSKGLIPFLLATTSSIYEEQDYHYSSNSPSVSSKQSTTTTTTTSSFSNNSSDDVINTYPSQSHSGPRIRLNENQKKEIKKTIDAKVIPGAAAIGAGIGAAFGPAGAAIGGVIGAAAGLVAWLWD